MQSGTQSPTALAGVMYRAADTARLLLCRQRPYGGMPPIWTLWGGGLEPGEEAEAGALLIGRDRTGYQGPARLVELGVYQDEDVVCHMYIANVDAEFTPKLDDEAEAFGWFSPFELPTPMSSGLVEILLAHKRMETLPSTAALNA